MSPAVEQEDEVPPPTSRSFSFFSCAASAAAVMAAAYTVEMVAISLATSARSTTSKQTEAVERNRRTEELPPATVCTGAYRAVDLLR